VYCSATFFCARKNAARFSLSGAKKRHLPPERYMQWGLIFFENIRGQILIKITETIVCNKLGTYVLNK